jgi:hypothetical protein
VFLDRQGVREVGLVIGEVGGAAAAPAWWVAGAADLHRPHVDLQREFYLPAQLGDFSGAFEQLQLLPTPQLAGAVKDDAVS